MTNKIAISDSSHNTHHDDYPSILCPNSHSGGNESTYLEKIIEVKQTIKKGEMIFRQGEAFQYIYIILSGTVKTYTISQSGEEQITSFYYPNDLVGLNSIDSDTYPDFAKALETTSFYKIAFNQLEELDRKTPNLKNNLFKIMSHQIHENQHVISQVGKVQSERRIASFLLNVASRYERQNGIGHPFKMPMSRNEIGNYLGLTVETVSRAMTKLHKKECIYIEGKHVTILNLNMKEDEKSFLSPCKE
ncbi:cyclic nucleotide-binding domain-containing protein [Marinomonas sp. 15G1-11]|uniref:Cyclic nucleotide-binding domain-containing protein n=1 Tax=Marinomonas phaeophyticola TaxID=3004091 RepID=A0ABT4JQU0_9GAMM|nr:cyclic nucleotide-binding domain-containing protein [Marinomonas sp. 15G1-11]MCZ2720741.1 cyclic nucleotide-binding domain-containing protein [Marinomonas sp. 15G1-11]